jgi:site-specific DNA recombinase
MSDGTARLLQQPREKWIEIKVPAIVDEVIFRAAQQIRERNKREKGKQHKNFYLLGGMLRCGHCGRFASGITKRRGDWVNRYYRCGTCQVPKRYASMCDNTHSFHMEAVDRAVWEFVTGIFKSPDVLKESLDDYQARQADEQSPIFQMMESTTARLEETEKEKARLLRAYTSGVLSLEEIATEKVELDKRAADLTRALSELRAELNPATISQEDIDQILQDAADFREGVLLADNDPLTQRRILKQLLFTGRLVYAEGKPWVEVDCILGSGVVSTEYMLLWRQEIGNG